MNSYKRLFEQISPSESDEQLISKVLARKEEASKKAENMKDNKKKNIFLRKAVIIPTAAAIALGATTLSVGAANNWDYSKPFRNMFAQSYEGNVSVNSEVHSTPVQLPVSDPTSNSVSEPASQSTTSSIEKVDYTPEKPIGTFDFEKYGKPLNTVMKGNGVTATLNGMLAYDDMCYIMYTLTATDEAVARCGGLVPALTIDFGNFGFKVDGKIVSGMGYGTDDISEEGNTRIGYIKIFYDHADLAGKTLNITFLAKTNSSPVLLKETKDILVDFPIAENVEKDLDLKLNIDTFDGRINKVTLGGFRAYLGIEGVEKEATKAPPVNSDDAKRIANRPNSLYFFDELQEYGKPVLTLKDGTTVAARVVGLSREGEDGITTGQIKLEYTYPVDPSDVVTLTFGEHTINF